MQQIRLPAVAGGFYPAQKEALVNDVKSLLNLARAQESDNLGSDNQESDDMTRDNKASDRQPGSYRSVPKAIIVPHAGYIYSGRTAAAAYSRITAVRDIIKRVILLGPVHRVPVRGLALPGADIFATPLGKIQIDQLAIETIKKLPQVIESQAAHAQEHSLEVQLPFLQSVLDDFTLLPLAVGDATPQEVAEVLNVLWGGPETLIVISSDLSHFLPYETAQSVDAKTVQHILQLDANINHQQACGGTPVNGLMLSAKQHRLQPQLLDIRNSGDTAGDKNQVVGYAAFAFNEAPAEIKDTLPDKAEIEHDDLKGKTLLQIARSAIVEELGKKDAIKVDTPQYAPWLLEDGACFITLMQGTQLRGCIGSLEAHRSLLDDVKANAKAAAIQDNRFPPLTQKELNKTQIEISLLSPMQELIFKDQQDALAQLVPEIDGILFEYDEYRATYLPQVWRQLPERKEFMAHLKQKAGLSAYFWSDDVILSRYSVKKWKESDFDDLSGLQEGEMEV